MARTINVVDMFHGDNQEKIPDFTALKNAGVLAVIHKVSEGTGYTDPKYKARRKACEDAGLLWGGYHFLGATNGEAQADYFLSRSGVMDNDGGPCLLACDFERGRATPSLQTCYEFMKAVDDAGAALGISCVLYSGDVVREALRPHGGGHQNNALAGVDDFFYKHRLWLAQYGPTAKCPWPWNEIRPPKTASGVWLWQWTETGKLPGVKGAIDGNFFPGTSDDLRATWLTG